MIGGSILAVILLIVVWLAKNVAIRNYCKNATEANAWNWRWKTLAWRSWWVEWSWKQCNGGGQQRKNSHRPSRCHGYLPEHTLPAKAMAYAQGAVIWNKIWWWPKTTIWLSCMTLSRSCYWCCRSFPGSGAQRRRYYAIDFTLDEIKSLKFTEVSILKMVRKYRLIRGVSRWVIWLPGTHFRGRDWICSGVKSSTGKNIGIYPEIKAPWFHHRKGRILRLKRWKCWRNMVTA